MDQCTHEVRAEYWKKIIQACGQRLNITVQNRGSSAIIRIIHPSHTLVLLLKVLCCISHT